MFLPISGEILAAVNNYLRSDRERESFLDGLSQLIALGVKKMIESILGPLHLVIAIWAILTILKSRAGTGAKILWVLVVLLLPLIGLIIWYFAGPK